MVQRAKSVTQKGDLVSIAEQLITLEIDVKSASIGTLPISISSSNIIGNIPIDITAQSIDNVAIGVKTSSIMVPVDIQAQYITLDINIAAVGVSSIPIDIVAQTVGNIGVDIKAQTVGNLAVNIAQNTLGNLTVDIAAQSVGNIAVNIAASAITLDINVTNAYLYVRTEATQNLNVDIKAQSVGNLAVDIAAQTVGNIAVDITAQTVGNLNVNIAASTVTLNITGSVEVTAGTVEVSALKSIIYTSESPITNPDFELGDLGWTLLSGAVITDAEAHKGSHSVKLPAGLIATAEQTFCPRLDTTEIAKLMFWAKGASGDYARGYLFFEDGTEQTEDFALTGDWVLCTIYPKRGKKVRSFSIMQIVGNTSDYYADDISVEMIDPVEAAVLRYWRFERGHLFVERWENGYFDKRKYKGRMGAYFKSEADKPQGTWTPPLFAEGVNTRTSAPWNNAVHLRNSIDGTTVDEVYFSPKEAFRRCILRFDAKIPNPANLPAGAHLLVGFEVTAQGGNAIATLHVEQNQATIYFNYLGRDGLTSVSDTVTINNPDDWMEYFLVLDPPYLHFYQQAAGGGSITRTNTVCASGFAFDGIKVLPFFSNESTVVVSGFYIGQFAVEEFNELKRPPELKIDTSSIAASGEAHTDLVLPETGAIAITISVTYDASATSGVRVYVLASPDNFTTLDSENTTDAFTYFEPSFAAGATRVKTVSIDAVPRFLRILVRNLDGTYATGAVKVWVTESEVR